MSKLLCKPCCAFDALASLVFCNYCRKDIPEVAEWVKNTYKGITIAPSNQFFDLLINHHSLDEIESFDLDRLIEVYPQYLKENAYTSRFEEEFKRGFEQLKESNFEKIWNDTLLPVLNRQCENFLNACDSEKVSQILADVEKIHGQPMKDDIVVYMAYFTYNVSFLLKPNCYMTNAPLGNRI